MHEAVSTGAAAPSRTTFVSHRIAAIIATCGPLLLIVALAALRGTLYATILPPWDYNDEEQHFDYVKRLSEEWRLPLMGTYLSSEILTSASDTGRWEHFHLSRPPVLDAQAIGLEGYSYEAYQPPLYYLLLAVPYRALDAWARLTRSESETSAAANALRALYGLRLFTVALAAATAGLSFAFLRTALNDHKLAALGTLLLTFVPERTMAVSRVNNDALLELFSVAGLTVLLRISRPTSGGAALLGLLLGLAILTKLSAVALIVPIALYIIWQATARRNIAWLIAQAALVLAPTALLTGWFFVRNAWLYGEPTGAAAFLRLAGFTQKHTLWSALVELAQALWMTRWQSAAPAAFAGLMMIVGIVSLAVLLAMLFQPRAEQHIPRHRVFLLLAAVIAWLIPLWWGIRTGVIQHIEGRFLIGAYAPLIALMLTGLQRALPSRLFWPSVFVLLTAFIVGDAAYLVVFSLPFYYSAAPGVLSSLLTDVPSLLPALAACYAVITATALLWASRLKARRC